MYKHRLYLHLVSSIRHQSQAHGLSIISQKMNPPELSPVRDRNGFTLLEILIAIFILATVLSTVFASYTGTLRVVRDTESRAEIYRMAGIALERIVEDLESVYMPEEAKTSDSEDTQEPFRFAGEDQEIQGMSADTLTFPSLAHLVFGEEDQPWGTTEISYYVEESDDGKGLILYRRDRPQWEEVSDEGGGGLPLCEGLVSVNFSYFDAEGQESQDWDPASEEGTGMPKIVSVALEFVNPSDPETPLKFATGVTLPISEKNEGKE